MKKSYEMISPQSAKNVFNPMSANAIDDNAFTRTKCDVNAALTSS
jgi:hypothetical protein